MEGNDKFSGCPSGSLSRNSMADDTNAESSLTEIPGIESASASSFVTDTTNSDNAVPESTPESAASGKRPRTKRGRSGKKWVGLNWEHKEHLKEQNNGVMPHSEALVTSSFPHCGEWSETNLPEILFYIKPPRSEYDGLPVGFVEEDGEPVKVGKLNKSLRDFPILPRRISLEVPGWLVETWRRIDPRITYPDILDRQVEDPELGLKKLDKNALQNHCRRECRMILGLWTNYERREVPHRTDVEAIECLSYQNILLNTVLNVSPDRQDRLTKLCLSRGGLDGCGKYNAKPCEVTAENWNETTFPLDHFVLKAEVPSNGLHPMDTSMLAAWELSLILQERARIHGVSHWKNLDDDCRPVSWFDRTANKRVENETFDGGCSTCTWDPSRDQETHRSWIEEIKSAFSKPVNRSLSTKGASSSTSKRRKVSRGRSQDASTNTVVQVVKECDCCKEAESSQNPGSPNEQYPSESFRCGEIKSFFRDADGVEDIQVNSAIGNIQERAVREEVVEHNDKGTNAKHSTQPGIAEDENAQLNTAYELQCGSSQGSDLQVVLPTDNEIHSPLTNYYSAEKDLDGIGSHLTGDEGEMLFQQAQVGSAMSSAERDAPFDLWMPPHQDLPKGFGFVPGQDEGRSADWDTADGSSSQAKVKLFSFEGSKEVEGDKGDWQKLIAQFATNLDAAPYVPLQVDQQEHFPTNGLDQSDSQQDTNAWFQSQPASFVNQSLDHGQGYDNWDTLPSSLPSAGVPGLATSFPTDNGSWGGEMPGSEYPILNYYGDLNMLNKPANTFQMDTSMGLSAVNDATPLAAPRDKGKGVLREIQPGFDTNEYYDTNSSHQQLEAPYYQAAPPVDSGEFLPAIGSLEELGTHLAMENEPDSYYYY